MPIIGVWVKVLLKIHYMTKKIEISEADLKQVILLIKMSRPFLRIPTSNLRLINLWRVSGYLADKLMRKAGLTFVTNNGKISLKSINDVVGSDTSKDALKKKEGVSSSECRDNESSPIEEPKRAPRCRKRKR